MNRLSRRIILATPAVVALREMRVSAQVQDGDVIRWPSVEDGAVLSSAWVKACNNVTTCFNNNNGRCWYICKSCGGCFNNHDAGYRLCDARCAYVNTHTGEKLCISTSSTCNSKCRSCP